MTDDTEQGDEGALLDRAEQVAQDAEETVNVFMAGGGDELGEPTAVQDPEAMRFRQILATTRALRPPYDPQRLVRIWENSSALGQNVDSYVTNIDGTGHRFEPVLDLTSDEAFERVREAMILQAEEDGDKEGLDPGEDAVEAKIEDLKSQARTEHLRLQAFFDNANPNGSFITLRRNMRQDQEVTGNAYWEVIRNKKNEPCRLINVASQHVRLLPVDKQPVAVEDKVSKGVLGWDTVTQYRFMRRYVQVVGGTKVYFKEYGDERVVSRKTGRVYAGMEEFEAKKRSGDSPANEMIHFKRQRPGEAYGAPLWIGNLLAVLGSRAADEVNFDYFDSKCVPPLALMVMGHRYKKDEVKQIETFFRERIKGRRNFHRILVLQANLSKEERMAGVTNAPKLEWKELMDAMQGDALFQKYDERNIDKVGSAFRLPRLLRGDVRDFNRATADASRSFAEEQVFDPERSEFDAFINRRILPQLNIRLWKFRSHGLRNRDLEIVGEIVEKLVKSGVLTINESRAALSDVLGADLPSFEEWWANRPVPMTLNAIGDADPDEVTEGGFGPDDVGGGDDDEEDDEKLRDLAARAAAQARRRQQQEREEANAEQDAAARAEAEQQQQPDAG